MSSAIHSASAPGVAETINVWFSWCGSLPWGAVAVLRRLVYCSTRLCVVTPEMVIGADAITAVTSGILALRMSAQMIPRMAPAGRPGRDDPRSG